MGGIVGIVMDDLITIQSSVRDAVAHAEPAGPAGPEPEGGRAASS